MYTKGKVNRLTLNFYDPSPDQDEVEAEYEAELKVVSISKVTKGVEFNKEPCVEFLLPNVVEADPSANALADEVENVVIWETTPTISLDVAVELVVILSPLSNGVTLSAAAFEGDSKAIAEGNLNST